MKIAFLTLLGLMIFASPAEPAEPSAAQRTPAQAMEDANALIDEIRLRIAKDCLMEPPGDSAIDALRSLRKVAPSRPEVLDLSRDLYTRMVSKGKLAMKVGAYRRAQQWLSAAREAGRDSNDDGVVQAEHELEMFRALDPKSEIDTIS